MDELLAQIRACRLCAEHLPLGPRPVLRASAKSKIIVVGQAPCTKLLGKNAKKNLTETVANYKEYLPKFFPLPHPSPRNLMWLRRNPWFEGAVVSDLERTVHSILYKS